MDVSLTQQVGCMKRDGVVVVSSRGQAVTPERCLSADRASRALADGRSCQTQHTKSQTESSIKKPERNLAQLRKKRLRRNRKKREALRKLSRKERIERLTCRITAENNGLKEKLKESQEDNRKEKRLSAFCWRRWEEEKQKGKKICRAPRKINQQNLQKTGDTLCILGKGSFGTCEKMRYRGITVAVKTFESHVKTHAALWEASVINQFDHPGLPLLYGICFEEKPQLMITQFHGIDGNCMTVTKAAKTSLLKDAQQWTRIFKETTDALLYVHEKDYLHNDIKGDNVLLTNDSGLHPVLIDFDGGFRELGMTTADDAMRPGDKAYLQLEGGLEPEEHEEQFFLWLCGDEEPCIKSLEVCIKHEEMHNQVVKSRLKFLSDLKEEKIVCRLKIEVPVPQGTEYKLPIVGSHHRRFDVGEIKHNDQVRPSTSKNDDQPQLSGLGNILDPKYYDVVSSIGKGAFAEVYLCKDKVSGEYLAAKVVELGENSLDVQEYVKALKKEISILRTLKNDFIVRYYATKETNTTLAMLMEYVQGGSIYQLITKNGPLDEQTTQRFTWQILKGVEYLHENGIIHRDIKGRNILLDKQGIIKISDFGISKDMRGLATTTGRHSSSGEGCFGTCYWMSPESISNEEPDQKSDIWSVGCTVVEMLVGKPPLLCDNIPFTPAMYKIINLGVHPPEQCSELAKEFLLLCFRRKDDRPTATQLMARSEFPKITS